MTRLQQTLFVLIGCSAWLSGCGESAVQQEEDTSGHSVSDNNSSSSYLGLSSSLEGGVSTASGLSSSSTVVEISSESNNVSSSSDAISLSSMAVLSSSATQSSSSKMSSSSSAKLVSSSSVKLVSSSSVKLVSSSSVKLVSSSSAKFVSSSSAPSSSSYDACEGLTWDAMNQICDARDGMIYGIISVGTQVWMSENLRYLPSVNVASQSSVNVARYYVYNNTSYNTAEAKADAYYKSYGVMYNRLAAFMGKFLGVPIPEPLQGVCPDGWHLPTLEEWKALANALGGMAVAGAKIRSKTDWTYSSDFVAGTDDVGFGALPGGTYSQKNYWFRGTHTSWWSTTEVDQFNTYSLMVYADDAAMRPQYDYDDYANYVRCVKN